VQRAESMLAWLAFRDRIALGEALPAATVMSDGGACYFRQKSVALEQSRDDDYGQLDITDKGIFYGGGKRLTLPWPKILTLEVLENSFIVHRQSGGSPHTFRFSFVGEAKRAHLVALTLWQQYQDAPTTKPPRASKKAKARTWVPQPHKDAVLLSAFPIGDASHRDLGSGAGSFPIGIVGESYRQAALQALDAGRLQRGEHVTFTATLVPEALHDPNGVRVEIQGGAHIGYLSREDAVCYRPVFEALAAQHLIGVARAKLIGGVAGKPSIGVMLDLNQPSDLLGVLAPVDQAF
jgi:hypothetical protein